MRAPFTIVSPERTSEVEARIDGPTVRVAPGDLPNVLGWELAPQGLCRGDTCVPVREPRKIADADGVDLAAVAGALNRPLALDQDERAAAIGAAAVDRGAALATLEAPDFSLPDLAGRLHSLSDHRGRKVLLIAYASW